MCSTLRFGIILCITIALLVPTTTGSMSRPPRNNDISTMADALKYLQDLDVYYGDRARMRYGKRASLAQVLHNRLMDNADLTHTAEYPPGEEPF